MALDTADARESDSDDTHADAVSERGEEVAMIGTDILQWRGPITVSRRADSDAIPTLHEVDMPSNWFYWERLILIEALERWLESLEAIL